MSITPEAIVAHEKLAIESRLRGDEQSWEVKYRPRTLDMVIGQDHVVKSLKGLLASKSRIGAFLFVGGAGRGKTTCAKIIANEYGVKKSGLYEIDAASNGGIDDVRAQVEGMLSYPIEGTCKMMIVDECHAISKQGWQAFLKPVEEPPKHAVYAFCTTELEKVPQTIRTRCHEFELKPIPVPVLEQYGSLILQLEGVTLPDGALSLIANSSDNGVRKLLVNLSKCRFATSIAEVENILSIGDMSDQSKTIEICRMMLNRNKTFLAYLPLISQIDSYSSFRAIAKSYIGKAAANATASTYMDFAVMFDCLDKLPAYPIEREGFSDVYMMLIRWCASK